MSQSQNVPFVSINNANGSCGANSPPMAMLGYQCNPGKQCTAITQFSYAPSGGAVFFSSEQCSNVCGGLASGTYVPNKALD